MSLPRADSAPRLIPTLIRLLPILIGLVLLLLFEKSLSEAKQRPVKAPDLRILEVALAPLPYLPTAGVLQLAVEVELPNEINGARMLEVSSFITSASKHSFRFLSIRQAVESPVPSDQTVSAEGKPRVVVTLTWDGTDQTMRRVERGKYNYEIRAKLLSVGDDGLRTQMVSWPKRGTIDVK